MANPFEEGSKEKYNRRRVKEVEACYLIRDLIHHSKETRELWGYLKGVLRIRQSVVLTEMGEGEKSTPQKDENGTVVYYNPERFNYGDYRESSGVYKALGWLEDEVEHMMQKADREDDRKKEEDNR